MKWQSKLKTFQPLFWFCDLSHLDLKKARNLIIHQVLAYGTMDDIRRLIKIFGKQVVRKEFKKPLPGLYHLKILNLCQYLLGVKKIDKNKYLKKIYV